MKINELPIAFSKNGSNLCFVSRNHVNLNKAIEKYQDYPSSFERPTLASLVFRFSIPLQIPQKRRFLFQFSMGHNVQIPSLKMKQMKTYQCPQAIALPLNTSANLRRLLLLLWLLSFYALSAFSQELVFKNAELISGTDKQDGAIYRFATVNNKVDALVTISGRSSNNVNLISFDMDNVGHDKAFQPRVGYGNGNTPDGLTEWWMEFTISFVNTGTNSPASVDSFKVTGLDIDGNGQEINEWVCFYNNQTYMFENSTLLQGSNMMEYVNSVATVVGRKFVGPTENFVDIDTTATGVMVTNKYGATNSFKLRTGATSTAANGASNRMYSFWFKSFNYQEPNEFRLPLVLLDFNTTLINKKVSVNWTTGKEKELSHFVIERSTNGRDYTEAGIVVANGSSNVKINYSFADDIKSDVKGILYYRLKMVDMDGSIQRSTVKLIRMGEQKVAMGISTFPNPVINELRVTVPASWQNSKLVLDVYNTNGQIVKQVTASKASQTEILNMNGLTAGVYFVKATSGGETAVQRVVKN